MRGDGLFGTRWQEKGAMHIAIRPACAAVSSALLTALARLKPVTRALALLPRLAASVPASAAPTARDWKNFEIIMWQPQPAKAWKALRRMGVSAGTLTASRDQPPTPQLFASRLAPLLATGTPFYVENIATDFYAAYHRWQPDHPGTWLFDQARAQFGRDPTGLSAFMRQPSLSDPAWQARIDTRLAAHVRLFSPYHPLYYNLADEAGIADLAAPWDFDFSPPSLASMRAWLRDQYPDLAALNREWGTHFASWEAVVPITTNAALARSDGNFAAWGDFKAWMDEAFARAERAGTDAVHAADPAARAGLEGAQVAGWGGYDYGLLAPAVDVMELYDDGANLAAAHALNPALVPLTTSFGGGPREVHRIWQEVLRGARGVVLWDENGGLVGPDGSPGPRGRDLAATFASLRGGPSRQIVQAMPEHDPVAILYSQASFRTNWLLARQADRKPWTDRGSAIEGGDDNPWRVAMRTAERTLTHEGVQPGWLTSAMVEAGALRKPEWRMLLLPQAVSLSPAEAAEIAAFAAHGGIVVADSEPGLFDAHSARQRRPLLAAAKMVRVDSFSRAALADPLREAHVEPGFHLTRGANEVDDVEMHVFHTGGVTILGLQRDVPAGPERLTLTMAHPQSGYDMMRGAPIGHADRFVIQLDGAVPALISFD
jgi:hypothetical protein